MVIYARVSSQAPVEETNSIERQLLNLHEIIEEKGFNLVHKPFTGPSVSGTEINQEGRKSRHEFLQTDSEENKHRECPPGRNGRSCGRLA